MTETHPSVSAVGQYLDEQVEIAALAQQYYQDEGCPEGRSEEHWLRAEREIRQRASRERPQQSRTADYGGAMEDAMLLAQ